MTVTVGLRAHHEREVSAGDTATAVGSGDVDVLATPRLLAWLEAATLNALRDALEPEQTSVGVAVSVEHLRPSGVGARVMAHAEVSGVQGKKVTFAVRAVDFAGELLARGEITRAVVNRERFVAHG